MSSYERKLLPGVLIIALIAVNIELDIYVPALPQMLHYFATTSGKLQWIISINFIGVSVGSLLYGPLSDHFGRKKIIIIGLFIFVVGSLGCILSSTLTELMHGDLSRDWEVVLPQSLVLLLLLNSMKKKICSMDVNCE